ncbi:MAG TPA: cardiolipin synthase ClsB [Burkholderiaceae bacterium]|nr:cardiolipin synthase ClsB [Burkholderiaceae bacterium]
MSERRFKPRLLRPRPQRAWVPGDRIELLENGEQYYPAVFDAIRQARQEVIIETFILFEDKVGLQLHQVLLEAARRGVSVEMLVDGFGSPDLSDDFLASLHDAGVRLRSFDPRPRLFGLLRTNLFRRMHRKIVVVDGEVAFVGGINFSADHLADYGPEAKQDYASRVTGPVVAQIHDFVVAQIRSPAVRHVFPTPAPTGDAEIMFVTRDNSRHRDDIERQYRAAIRVARHEVIIANAYFFPGYRLLKTLLQAARRGVRVRLILQGQPDMRIVKVAAQTLHGELLAAGVEIHEYCKRPLHGKVALVDDRWATIGSSNLDPLSLSLNLEANLMTRDRSFIEALKTNLEELMANDCSAIQRQASDRAGLLQALLTTIAYHLTRRFPVWAGRLPEHRPRLAPLRPSTAVEAGAQIAGPVDSENVPPTDAQIEAQQALDALTCPRQGAPLEGDRDARAGAVP